MDNARKRRKEANRRKRQREQARDASARVRYRQTYPDFEFIVPDDVDPNFVEMVRSGLKHVNFDDRKQFRKDEANVWKAFKMRGPKAVYEAMVQQAGDDARHPAIKHFFKKIGNIVFAQLPVEKVKEYTPYQSVTFLPGRTIQVRFRALKVHRGDPHGTIYYSRHKPKVDLEGKQRVVGFSKHSIEQIIGRLSYQPDEFELYSWSQDMFMFFDLCTYYEPLVLPNNNQHAFTFFAECVPNYFNWRFVEEVWAGEIEEGYKYYFRLGYCPANIRGDFLVAKTVLYPGYTNTPEHELLCQYRFPTKQDKEDMIQRAKMATGKRLQDTDDFSLFHFFHLHGVPQVRATEDVYYETSFKVKKLSSRTQHMRKAIVKQLLEQGMI